MQWYLCISPLGKKRLCYRYSTFGGVSKRLQTITMGRGGTPKDYIGLHGGGGQFGQTIAKAKNQRNPDF